MFYKEGTSGVVETDTEHIDANLTDQNFNGINSTTISGLSEGLDYVFNIWAYDIYGNKTSATEINISTNDIPASPSALIQYKNNTFEGRIIAFVEFLILTKFNLGTNSKSNLPRFSKN